jgi:hypothetical protein
LSQQRKFLSSDEKCDPYESSVSDSFWALLQSLAHSLPLPYSLVLLVLRKALGKKRLEFVQEFSIVISYLPKKAFPEK